MLFLGAGFSLAATNIGRTSTLPSVEMVKRDLWKLCFPDEEFSSDASLQNLYESALRLHGSETADLLRSRLTVDSETLPDWYELYFAMPWARVYTLNVDDLPRAVGRRFPLPRQLHLISAVREQYEPRPNVGKPILEIVHLNGDIDGIPNQITFSTTQYAERIARPDPWYVRVVADLVSRPFVFVGTQLEEPALWQHVELRRHRGGRGTRELRPRSYLVVPKLDAARRSLLAEYNVSWLPMDAQVFQAEILAKLQSVRESGLKSLARQAGGNPFELRSIPLVSSLASTPEQNSEFLVGEHPSWSDIQDGRAVSRACDDELWSHLKRMLSQTTRGVVVVTGTAGSGKSTGLKRAALRLNAEGQNVGWLDSEGSLSPHEIRVGMREKDAPAVLCIDDADMYGSELSSMVRELCLRPPYPLVMVGIRSGRVDLVLHEKLIHDVPVQEFAMPHLADPDIDGLLDVLDRENRLGLLRGKPREVQVDAFRNQAGRQLLVAMIQATSGRRFEEKAVDELIELGDDARVYGLIAVASAYRFSLQRNEILLGLGEATNAVLNTVDMLIRRHVVRIGHDGGVWTRHRVIAEVIRDELQKSGAIKELLQGLAHVAATQVSPDLARSARPWRLLRQIINHDFLIRIVGPDAGRNLYGEIENLLRWDYHFWLQRGSLEVEMGDLDLAENFLNQARALSPTDFYVQTEYAYLLMRKAIESPTTSFAPDLVRQATDSLTALIERTGERDNYAFHVLGSQGLAWARRGISSSIEKEQFLREIMSHLQNGIRLHPRSIELKKLLEDVKQEHLNIAVPAQRVLIRPT